MGLLSKIQSGRQRKPVTVCVYGVPGVGKTSFASAAPKPIVFDLEGGSSFLNVSRVEPQQTWEEFVNDVRELVTAEHTFKTLVVDTLDALEALAIAYVCQNNGKKTLADFSYGAGYAHLQQEWRLFLRALEVLREKRDMNIVLIAHEHRKSFSDPELGAFEVYRPKLQDKVWALTNEWCDAVLFAQFDQALLEKKDQKDRVIISGRRVLRTQRGTGYVAKNRFGLPEVIDLDWKTFETAAQPIPVETLKATLTSLLAQASDDIQAKAKTYLAERGETPETLRAVTERVQTLIAQAA
jgi:hypothetical protein